MSTEALNHLTEQERAVLGLYREPGSSDLSRALRLSVQYALGAGVFLYLAIANSEPLYAIGIYLAFLAQMAVRLVLARRVAGVIPKVLSAYEVRIQELEARVKELGG